MKWLIPGIWLAAILFAHFRGRVKLPLGRQLLDHSVLLAPVNAFMVDVYKRQALSQAVWYEISAYAAECDLLKP